jgi:hypothetical protein
MTINGMSSKRLGIFHWQRDDGIGKSIVDGVEELGHSATVILPDDRALEGVDAVVAYGPFGSLVPLVNQLLRIPPSQRPLLAMWMTEQFPNPNLPEWLRYSAGSLRSLAERLAFQEKGGRQRFWQSVLRPITSGFARFRYYGDLFWLQRQGLLSTLAIESPWTADYLRRRGFDPVVTYWGSDPSWWADLQLQRDVPVLWLGKPGTNRRRRLVSRIRQELGRRGIPLLVIDGVEKPYLFGHERTVLLNRTMIVLNIMRTWWDDNTMRYYLAAPNRALIVTEPTLPHSPFLPNLHLVETPIEQMADTIVYYLTHDEERLQIVERAYELVTRELTMHKAVQRVIERLFKGREQAEVSG